MQRRPLRVSDLAATLSTSTIMEDRRRLMLMLEIVERYRSALAVPLFIKNEIYGAIVLYYRETREFTDEEVRLAVAFGDQAALAVENARLRAQVGISAAAAERQRLARDLHDAVTQTLFSASLIADVLPRLWDKRPEDARKRLDELRELTRGALAEMRTLLLELRPSTLTEVELSELLRQLTEAMIARARLPVTLTIENEPPLLPPDVQVALYRIAQEALNNVTKHAGASAVSVHLRTEDERLTLVIEDNGRGFDPANVPPDHMGVGIMRERAETIGAALEIDSRPGQGTRLQVQWETGSKETVAS
jgi:signal transduction histidine kinase